MRLLSLTRRIVQPIILLKRTVLRHGVDFMGITDAYETPENLLRQQKRLRR